MRNPNEYRQLALRLTNLKDYRRKVLELVQSGVARKHIPNEVAMDALSGYDLQIRQLEQELNAMEEAA